MIGREELITPEIARIYLKKSAGNRPLSRAKVEQYKADIASGNWQLTSDGIAFTKSGILKNGHHRLTAIIETGVPATMWVVYDVPDETTAYDIGKSRPMSQYLRFNENLPTSLSSNSISAIVKLHHVYSTGVTAAARMPMAETAKFIRTYAEALVVSDRICCMVSSKRSLIHRASVGYSLFCALQCGIPESELYQFASVVSSGLYEDIGQSAAVMVRNYLLVGSRSTIRHGDAQSRVREIRVVQAGLADFISKRPRKRSYDENKCSAIYSDQFISNLKEKSNAAV